MKQRIYLRIGKTGQGKYKVIANTKSNNAPIDNGSKHGRRFYPTVSIALDIKIPDSEFENTRILLDAKIEETKPCVEIEQIQTEVKNETIN